MECVDWIRTSHVCRLPSLYSIVWQRFYVDYAIRYYNRSRTFFLCSTVYNCRSYCRSTQRINTPCALLLLLLSFHAKKTTYGAQTDVHTCHICVPFLPTSKWLCYLQARTLTSTIDRKQKLSYILYAQTKRKNKLKRGER